MLNLEQLSGKDLFKTLEENFFSEEFTLKDLNISARRLMNWSEEGLLPESDRERDGNHRFSFVDLIWLKLVFDLRSNGFQLYKIKRVKEFLLKKRTILEILGFTNDKELVEWFFQIFANAIPNNKKK